MISNNSAPHFYPLPPKLTHSTPSHFISVPFTPPNSPFPFFRVKINMYSNYSEKTKINKKNKKKKHFEGGPSPPRGRPVLPGQKPPSPLPTITNLPLPYHHLQQPTLPPLSYNFSHTYLTRLLRDNGPNPNCLSFFQDTN